MKENIEQKLLLEQIMSLNLNMYKPVTFQKLKCLIVNFVFSF